MLTKNYIVRCANNKEVDLVFQKLEPLLSEESELITKEIFPPYVVVKNIDAAINVKEVLSGVGEVFEDIQFEPLRK